MTRQSRYQEKSFRSDASAEKAYRKYPRTTNSRLFVFLKIIVDKTEDEG